MSDTACAFAKLYDYLLFILGPSKVFIIMCIELVRGVGSEDHAFACSGNYVVTYPFGRRFIEFIRVWENLTQRWTDLLLAGWGFLYEKERFPNYGAEFPLRGETHCFQSGWTAWDPLSNVDGIAANFFNTDAKKIFGIPSVSNVIFFFISWMRFVMIRPSLEMRIQSSVQSTSMWGKRQGLLADLMKPLASSMWSSQDVRIIDVPM